MTHNNQELEDKMIIARLMQKFDKNYIPSAFEQFKTIVYFIIPIFRVIKTLVTIFTPSTLFYFILYSCSNIVVCEIVIKME